MKGLTIRRYFLISSDSESSLNCTVGVLLRFRVRIYILLLRNPKYENHRLAASV